MANLQKIPVGRKAGERKIELPEKIELPDLVQVSLAELPGKVKQGLLAFSVDIAARVRKLPP